MSIFQRAWLYITRKRGRSILLFLIMLITAVFTMLGLAIKASADEEAAAVRKSLGSSFTIEENGDAIRTLMANYEDGYIPLDERPRQPDIELMDRIKAMDHVTDYFTIMRETVWYDLRLRPGSFMDLYNHYDEDPRMQQEVSFDQLAVRIQINNIYGCTSTELHENFRNGAFSLVQGRHITIDDQFKVLISTALAARNGLSVGDMITVEIRGGLFQFDGDMYEVWGEPIDLQVIGLYDINFEQEPTTFTNDYGNIYVDTLESQLAENMILCDMTAAVHINAVTRAYILLYRDNKPIDPTAVENADIKDESFGSVTFFVDDSKNLDAAIAEVRSLDEIDKKYFDIFPDDSAYQASVKPLNTLATVSAVLIAAVIVGCAVILGLLLNMWVKVRRHEMGVLMSMGISSRMILLQLLLETTTFAVLSLIFAVCLSGLLAGPVGNIAEKLVSPKNAEETYTVRFNMLLPIINKVSAEPVDLSYGLSAANILITAIVIVVSAIGSVLVTSWNIMKLNPKHVLTRH